MPDELPEGIFNPTPFLDEYTEEYRRMGREGLETLLELGVPPHVCVFVLLYGAQAGILGGLQMIGKRWDADYQWERNIKAIEVGREWEKEEDVDKLDLLFRFIAGALAILTGMLEWERRSGREMGRREEEPGPEA